MSHPFDIDEQSPSDATLIEQATAGDREALSTLIQRHRPWIYALSQRLVLSPVDAEDLTQEALVRIITRLGQFEGRSRFTTWAWRIVVNRFRDLSRRPMEQAITTFEAYGEELDAMPLEPLAWRGGDPEKALIVEEAKLGCMLGMLLCLDREQRLAFVLGEVFEAPAAVAAEILEVSPATFRKRLQRARRDLHAFMQSKCGLVKAANPCRCSHKANAFMRAGWLDPESLKFTGAHVDRIRTEAQRQCADVDALTEAAYSVLFRAHPLGRPQALVVEDLTALLSTPAAVRLLAGGSKG
ncbi:MAG: RNA polymerase sigma factor [Bradymonadia bacterium]